jgi:uncharacterized RDD family membrane protein YckC
VDESPIFGSLPAAEPPTFPSRYIAGFWRRLFAFLIDAFLVSIPCLLLGYGFHGFFSGSSRWAAAMGLVITLPYFAILGSSIGRGQTVGQRLTGIEVVDAQGNHLPLGKSLLRYSILLVSLAFANAFLPAYMAWPLGMALVATIYLYLFNTRTRESLHDLAAGSFVVETLRTGGLEGRRLWLGHWAILGALGIVGIVSMALIMHTAPMTEETAVERALLDSGEFQEVGVMVRTHYPGHETDLQLTVKCKSKPMDYGKAAKEIVTIAEGADPEASQQGLISVNFKEGFNVGFVSYSLTKRLSHTPQQWREMARTD